MHAIRPHRFVSLALLLAALPACNPGGGDPLGPPPADVGSLDGGVPGWWGRPIASPDDRWTWIDFPETHCADGSPTGLAINPSPSDHPSGTVIYMEGGGACWSSWSCNLHWGDLGLALHLDGYDQAKWESLWGELYSQIDLFDRDDADNPFREANFVFLPYCTGDVFAGQAVRTLDGLLGGTRTYYFTGHDNMVQYLERLVPTFHDTDRVWLIGSSAGGFGAEMNWPTTQEMFGDVRVDVISDSGQPIDPPPDTWEQWLGVWDLYLPPDCADCDQGPDRIIDHYLESGLIERDRYGLIVFREDFVISTFFGLTQQQHAEEVDALLAHLDDPTVPGTDRASYFARPGAFHTTFLVGWDVFEADGVPLRDWLTMFVQDDPNLPSVGPD